MRIFILFLFVFASPFVYAEGSDIIWVPSVIGTQESVRKFDRSRSFNHKIIDLIDKEEKINACIVSYIEKQSKSYARMVQKNLYELLHNLDDIASKIQGKKPREDAISFKDKIEALAKVQCEAYYSLNVL